MTNKTGFILGLISAIIYVVILYGIDISQPLDFLAYFLGALLIPAIIAGLIYLFSRKNFGKTFGITCIILDILSILGNSLM